MTEKKTATSTSTSTCCDCSFLLNCLHSSCVVDEKLSFSDLQKLETEKLYTSPKIIRACLNLNDTTRFRTLCSHWLPLFKSSRVVQAILTLIPSSLKSSFCDIVPNPWILTNAIRSPDLNFMFSVKTSDRILKCFLNLKKVYYIGSHHKNAFSYLFNYNDLDHLFMETLSIKDYKRVARIIQVLPRTLQKVMARSILDKQQFEHSGTKAEEEEEEKERKKGLSYPNTRGKAMVLMLNYMKQQYQTSESNLFLSAGISGTFIPFMTRSEKYSLWARNYEALQLFHWRKNYCKECKMSAFCAIHLKPIKLFPLFEKVFWETLELSNDVLPLLIVDGMKVVDSILFLEKTKLGEFHYDIQQHHIKVDHKGGTWSLSKAMLLQRKHLVDTFEKVKANKENKRVKNRDEDIVLFFDTAKSFLKSEVKDLKISKGNINAVASEILCEQLNLPYIPFVPNRLLRTLLPVPKVVRIVCIKESNLFFTLVWEQQPNHAYCLLSCC